MKRIIFSLVALAALITMTVFAVSCGEESDVDSTVTLNVYNWGEYISDGSIDCYERYNTNEEFEKYFNENLAEKYGFRIKVNYTTYATNEDMYAKLSSGAGNYDVIIPSDYMIDKMRSEGMLYEFDVTELENFKNISKEFTGLFYDEHNRYSVPYTYGMVGIIYNTTMVDEEDVKAESWDLMWNPKYAGKILQFNNPRDGFATAMFKEGLNINSTKAEDWDKALELLAEQKPLVQGYVSDEIFNKLISNSASIGAYYAGDYITMSDSNPDLAFYYPDEGTNVFVDAMCIPKNAKNKEVAKEYINFMLSEEPAVANAIYTGYASPNTLVRESEIYAEEMEDAYDILYSDEDVNANYAHDPYYHRFDQDIQDYTNALWEELKTQNSTELWVHITAIVIVGGLLIFATYNIYVKKMRSRDYRKRDRERLLKKNQSENK